MAYLPPAPLNFDFSAAYPGTLDFVFLPVGTNQRIDGLGTDTSEFGTASLQYKVPTVLPVGTDTSVFGAHYVFNRVLATRTVQPIGIEPPPFGTTSATQRLLFDFVTPIPAPIAGDAVHFQFVPLGANRQVYPQGIASYRSGVVRIDYSPYLYPVGFDDTAWGEHRIADKRDLVQTAKPPGWTEMAFGLTTISRGLWFQFVASDAGYVPPTPFLPFNFFNRLDYPQYILPDGHDSTEFGLTTEVHLYRKYVGPYGFFDEELGKPMVANRNRYLFYFGWVDSEFGKGLVTNWHQAANAVGFVDSMVSEPRVHNTLQRIVVYPGFETIGFGLPKLTSSIGPRQSLFPVGFDAVLWGRSAELPLVAFEFRSISFELIPSSAQTQFGAHYIGYRIRQIFPLGEPYVQWGLPRLGYSPKAWPVGTDMSLFGMAAMSYGNVLAPPGFDALELGVFFVQFAKRYIKPKEEKEQTTYGTPYIWNLRQYIVEDNSIYFQNAPPFGFDTRIYNRSRPIYPEGVVPPKIERTHLIHNTGVAVAPPSVVPTAFGETNVWFRVRTVTPTGYVAGMIGEYHYVYNYATRVYPEGFDTQEFPFKHMAWFNGQTVTPYGFDRMRFGLPFISEGSRVLDQQLTTDTLTFGETWVSHSPRTVVELPWPDQILIPSPLVQIHFTIIRPHSVVPNDYGRPTVRNVTPQLFPGTFYSMGVGEPWVSRSPRFLTPEGFSVFASPQQSVTYGNRTIFVGGINSFGMYLHKIWQEVAGELDDRILEPVGIDPTLPATFVGTPSLRSNVLYPEGWNSAKFGEAKSDTQGCMTRWYNPDSLYQFGVPSLNPTQTINLNFGSGYNLDKGGGIDGTQWTKQRVDPHTIWCRHDTPQQAIDNHPESKQWCDMDRGPLCDLPPRPYFGNATVSTPHTEYLKEYHLDESQDFTVGGWIGEETYIQNLHRRIYVDKGIYMFKPGMQTYLNGPRFVWPETWKSQDIGEHRVSTAVDDRQWIGPRGWDSFTCPKHVADNFNRPIYPAGWTITEWGNNDPMVYHYPRGPKNVSGTDMLTFGPDTWISPYVREIFPEGSESFEEGYTLQDFSQRLRVKQGPGYIPPSVGDALRMGLPYVGQGSERGGEQYIRPYMIPPPQYCHPHSVEEVV